MTTHVYVYTWRPPAAIENCIELIQRKTEIRLALTDLDLTYSVATASMEIAAAHRGGGEWSTRREKYY